MPEDLLRSGEKRTTNLSNQVRSLQTSVTKKFISGPNPNDNPRTSSNTNPTHSNSYNNNSRGNSNYGKVNTNHNNNGKYNNIGKGGNNYNNNTNNNSKGNNNYNPTPYYNPNPTPNYNPNPTPSYNPNPTPSYNPNPTPNYTSNPNPRPELRGPRPRLPLKMQGYVTVGLQAGPAIGGMAAPTCNMCPEGGLQALVPLSLPLTHIRNPPLWSLQWGGEGGYRKAIGK